MENIDDSNAEVPIEPTEDLTIAGSDATEKDQLRQERIIEYAAQALSKESVLESNLASINCGLLKIAFWLEQSIGEATTKLPMTPERKLSVYRAIDTHLRITRQIDRFAQIELRTAHPRQIGPKASMCVKAVGDTPFVAAGVPSEDWTV